MNKFEGIYKIDIFILFRYLSNEISSKALVKIQLIEFYTISILSFHGLN
jgi:hypothetical protein